MAHLLNSSFLRSSSSLYRIPIFPPSSRAATGNRSRTQIIQANIREVLMPAMSDGNIVSQGDKISKAASLVVFQSSTVEIGLETFYDGNSAAIMVGEGGVAAAQSTNALLAETGDEIDKAKSMANSSASPPSAVGLSPSSAELQLDKVNDNVGPSSAVKAALSCRDGKSFIYNSSINIAVALAMDGGLITSVLQNAHKVDIYSLLRKWSELVDKARDKELQPHEYNTGPTCVQ